MLQVRTPPLHFNRRVFASHVLHQSISIYHPRQQFSSCYGQPLLEQCTTKLNIFMGLAVALQIDRSQINSSIYAILALIMLFYSVSGFIADVCYGQLQLINHSSPLSCYPVNCHSNR